MCLFAAMLFAGEIVLKNGKVIEGTIVKEIGGTVILKDSHGVLLNIEKEEIDNEKTAERNKTGVKKPANTAVAVEPKKKPPKVLTKEYLESLREKYDLGENSFGEAYELDLSQKTRHQDFQIQDAPDFEREVLRASVPVMVDFWASWCGPCRAIAPHVNAVEKEFEGKALVVRVNVDEQPDLASYYHVQAIPALIFFNKGEPVDEIVGFATREVIAERLSALIE